MSRTRYVDDTASSFVDEFVEVAVDEVLSGGCAEVAQEAALDVR